VEYKTIKRGFKDKEKSQVSYTNYKEINGERGRLEKFTKIIKLWRLKKMKEVIFKNKGVVDDTVSLALWLEVIRQADLMKDLDCSVVGCTKDKDNQCRRRGCINNQIAAPIFSRVRLLKLKEKALNWLKKHPNFRPEIENLREFLPVASLSELEDEIKKIEYASEVNEVKEVFEEVTSSFIDSKRTEVAMVDVFEDINTYPCPREITVNGEKTGDVVVDQFN